MNDVEAPVVRPDVLVRVVKSLEHVERDCDRQLGRWHLLLLPQSKHDRLDVLSSDELHGEIEALGLPAGVHESCDVWVVEEARHLCLPHETGSDHAVARKMRMKPLDDADVR